MSFQLSLFANNAKRRLLIWVPTVELQVLVQLHGTDRHCFSMVLALIYKTEGIISL